MPDEILRTFIAIELEEPLRIAIARVQGKFKRQAPIGSVKWVAPEGIHLTLKFLGDTPARRVDEIATRASNRVRGQRTVRVQCGRPRVLSQHAPAARRVGRGAG